MTKPLFHVIHSQKTVFDVLDLIEVFVLSANFKKKGIVNQKKTLAWRLHHMPGAEYIQKKGFPNGAAAPISKFSNTAPKSQARWDRIDIHFEVPAVPYRDLMGVAKGEHSSTILERVNAARARQSERFHQTKIVCNAQMGSRHIKKYCRLDAASLNLMESAILKRSKPVSACCC
ncbi:MAG: hypothetical protein WA151_20420 [Desulfatirhabdiaceae bacterium]